MRLDVAEQGGANRQQGGGREPPVRRDTTVWTRRHASVFSSIRLAASRFTRSWQLLLAVALGMLVAVVLICTVPLYDALVSDLQLQRAINTGGPVVRDVEVTAMSGGISTQERDHATTLMSGLASTYLAPYTTSTPTYYSESDRMGMKRAGAHTINITDAASPEVKFFGFDMTAAAPHMHFLAGGPAAASSTTVPVYVTAEFARDDGLVPGSQIVVTQYGGTEFGAKEIDLTVTVAGVFNPNDANETYWNGFSFSSGGTPTSPNIYPVLMPVNAFFNSLAQFTLVSMTQHFVYYTRPEALNTGNMGTVVDDIARLRAHINGELLTLPGVQQIGVLTQLDTTIQNVQAQASLLSLPLYMIVAQVVGLALLFVAAMAGLLVEAQAQEIATLKSRGASGAQLLGTFTTQGVFLGILVALAGPFLAALLAVTLLNGFVASGVLTSSGVTSRYLASIARPSAVLLPAIVGAALGVGAILFAAFQSARMDVLAFRREQGRTSRPPFWRRYYLDVALAALCGVGYLELNSFGSVNTRQQLGSASASPLLLVTPALLLLAGALLVLRVFPLGAALGARLAARGRGLTPLLAFAQVERNPQRYSRITLLLVLSVGLGLFALTFDSSLQRNTTDRATYSVGADARVDQNFGEGNGRGAEIAGKIARLPGVLGVTPVYRTLATSTINQGNAQVDLLGIDPATWQEDAGNTSWRADYANQSLSTLMASMRAHADAPEAAGTQAAPVWAMISDVFASQYALKQGDTFSLQLSETANFSTVFVVGAIIQEFPTLYPNRVQGSFLVVNINDLFAAIDVNSVNVDTTLFGPNEYWLRTTQDPAQEAALQQALGSDSNLDVKQVTTLSQVESQNEANPVGAGMRGLLLVGAVTAALLAVLGSIIQSLLATRRRATQFAVLRTVGMAGRQLTGLLLGEQVVVYVFGLVGGTLLGLLLVNATLPFLEFSDTTIDPTKLGVPPYALVLNAQGTAIFYGALLLAFVVALLIAARYATTIGLGKALRLGED